MAAGTEQLVAELSRYGEIAVAVEQPGAVVLSGPVDAVDALAASGALSEYRVRPVDSVHGFHSPLMAMAGARLSNAIAAVPAQQPRLPLVSNLTGGWMAPDEPCEPGYWMRHLLDPVRLNAGMTTVLNSGCNVFVELGPGTSMCGALRRHRDWSAAYIATSMFTRPDEDDAALLRTFGALWARGLNLPLEQLLPARTRSCTLPARRFAPTVPRRTTPGPKAAVPTGARTASDDLRAVLTDLWRGTLGVAAVDDSDDFFALGGESLLAVQLLDRVGQRTGRQDRRRLPNPNRCWWRPRSCGPAERHSGAHR